MTIKKSFDVRCWQLAVFLFLAVIVLMAGCSRQAYAQQEKRPGFGAYAIFHEKWNCDALMALYAGVPTLRMSVLWTTFGRKMGCLNRWAADPRPKELEFHLINEVCQRNKRCDKNELLYGLTVEAYRKKLLERDQGLLNRIRDYVAPVRDWLNQHTDVSCSYSIGLESNLDAAAARIAGDNLKEVMPARCKPVWNPVNNNRYGKAPIAGYVHELHGANERLNAPCRVNLDGVDVALKARGAIVQPKINASELPSFFKSYASCDAADIWVAESNGLEGGSFIFPLRRSKFLTKKVAQELNGYMRPEKPVQVPAWSAADEKGKVGCKSYLDISDGAKVGFLWKQSEPDCCGRGAVGFLPVQYNKLKLDKSKVFVMKAGKKIATAYEASRYTEDGKNRQFWRFKKKAPEFPFNIVLHYGNICAVIPNPKVRND